VTYTADCGCVWRDEDAWRAQEGKRWSCMVGDMTKTPDQQGSAESKPDAPSGYAPPPGHYSTGTGIDPWAVWDAFDLDRYTANAVKYLLRAGKKDIAPRMDDLIKAKNYVAKAIEREGERLREQ
jgi:hypothetical protein